MNQLVVDQNFMFFKFCEHLNRHIVQGCPTHGSMQVAMLSNAIKDIEIEDIEDIQIN